jgi:hypothetical protein
MKFHAFISSALHGSECSASRPGRLTRGEELPVSNRLKTRTDFNAVTEINILTALGIVPQSGSRSHSICLDSYLISSSSS